MSGLTQMIQGFMVPVQGALLMLSRPRYFLYALIPFGIGLGFILVGYGLASEYLNPMITDWVGQMESFKDWPLVGILIGFFLVMIGWVLVSVVNFLLAYICIMILAGPFYALMVERIFRDEVPEMSPQPGLKIAINMFMLALVKIIIFAVIGLICFIVAFFPPLNLAAALVLVLLVAFDCTDYSFEVDRRSLSQRFGFFQRHFFEYLGMSGAILLTGLIPGSFFLLLPAFICGATKMYIQRQQNQV